MPGKKAAAAQETMASSLVALYRCSCVSWKPSPIVCVSACPDGSVIAVAREDGDIEFWDTDSWSLTLVRAHFSRMRKNIMHNTMPSRRVNATLLASGCSHRQHCPEVRLSHNQPTATCAPSLCRALL
jgi:WD40 repeat protein